MTNKVRLLNCKLLAWRFKLYIVNICITDTISIKNMAVKSALYTFACFILSTLVLRMNFK
jgi:hypothetical protein